MSRPRLTSFFLSFIVQPPLNSSSIVPLCPASSVLSVAYGVLNVRQSCHSDGLGTCEWTAMILGDLSHNGRGTSLRKDGDLAVIGLRLCRISLLIDLKRCGSSLVVKWSGLGMYSIV